MRSIVATFLLTLVTSGSAAAQVCFGTAPFSSGPVQISAGAQFGEGAKGYGASVAFGAAKGPFASAGLSKIDYDDLDEGSMVYSARVGFSVPVSTAKKVDFCPILTAEMASGPDLDFGSGPVEFSASSFGLGFGVGGVASSSATFDFVPFGAAAYYHTISKAEFGGATEKVSDDVGQVILGAGFVLNKTVTLQPNVSFPLGVEDGDPSFGFTVSLNLGAKR